MVKMRSAHTFVAPLLQQSALRYWLAVTVMFYPLSMLFLNLFSFSSPTLWIPNSTQVGYCDRSFHSKPNERKDIQRNHIFFRFNFTHGWSTSAPSFHLCSRTPIRPFLSKSDTMKLITYAYVRLPVNFC